MIALAQRIGCGLLAGCSVALDRGGLRRQFGAKVRKLALGSLDIAAHDRPRRPSGRPGPGKEGHAGQDQARALERLEPRQGGLDEADHATSGCATALR